MDHTTNSAGSTTQNKFPWQMRRRFMVCVITFCMGVIIYVLATDTDSEAAQTAVSMGFAIIGTTMASYVFGATWQDVSIGSVNHEVEYKDDIPD